jgi:hypothetical protein
MRSRLAAIGAATLCLIAPPRVASRAGTALPVPVIVELFTSEGCSSCPPADQMLGDLVRTQPVTDVLIVGLGEHVDYWDHQGWRDPFSDKLFSVRQSAYAAARASGEVYTPQMIVDGTRVVVAQDRLGAVDAIRRSAAAPKTPVRLAWRADTPSSLDIQAEAGIAGAGAQVFLAMTEDALSSSVTAGENAGRHLTHPAVVRQLRDLGRTDSTGAFHKTTAIKLDASWRRSALRAVVFIQRRPLGAITAVGISPVQLP